MEVNIENSNFGSWLARSNVQLVINICKKTDRIPVTHILIYHLDLLSQRKLPRSISLYSDQIESTKNSALFISTSLGVHQRRSLSPWLFIITTIVFFSFAVKALILKEKPTLENNSQMHFSLTYHNNKKL